MRTAYRSSTFHPQLNNFCGSYRAPHGRASAFLAFLLPLIILGGCAHHHVSSQPPAQTPYPNSPTASQPRVAPGPSRASGAPPAIERQPAVPGEYVEEGVASWYGVPFNGRRTSNGEIYDMHEFTAAHRTLPFGTSPRRKSAQRKTNASAHKRSWPVRRRPCNRSFSFRRAGN